MSLATKNVPGSVYTHVFSINTSAPTFTYNNTRALFSYIGTANPILTANLTTYEYSLDGSSWTAMTPSGSTVTTGLAFTITGASFSFEWMIKQDLGDDIYNKNIYVRFQATSGAYSTSLLSYTVYFEKSVTNEAQQEQLSYLPDDYSGIDGGDLIKELAPKTI